VAGLVDTNVLVYRFDPRSPLKQERATELLRAGVEDGSIVIPYQALVEFVAAVTRPISGKESLLTAEEAHQEVDFMLAQFAVLYPTENTLRTALRGAALYKMNWFDALIWAYADERGLDTLWSEDFQHGGLYGRVRVQNPFLLSVHEPQAEYGRKEGKRSRREMP
jgi:predicted nucleic acid-binding protein